MLMSCLLIRSFRRSLSACPQFLVAFSGIGGNGESVCGLWLAGCGMWVGGELGKNNGSTILITNAGAKRSYFFKTYKIVRFGKMYNFVHLEIVSMIFTDSSVGVCHLGEMYNFVHLGEMAMVVETYTTFVT